MKSNHFPSILLFAFFLFVLLPKVHSQNPSNTFKAKEKIHVNPIAQIFSELDVPLPEPLPGNITLSLGEKESVKKNTSKFAKEIIVKEKKALSEDLNYTYEVPTKPYVVCRGGICPCLSYGNQYYFVTAGNNNAAKSAASDNRFVGMSLIINNNVINLPKDNITVGNKNYTRYTLDVSDYQSFPNGTKLKIRYKPETGPTYSYTFDIKYDENSVKPGTYDGMIISK